MTSGRVTGPLGLPARRFAAVSGLTGRLGIVGARDGSGTPMRGVYIFVARLRAWFGGPGRGFPGDATEPSFALCHGFVPMPDGDFYCHR